MSWVDHPDPGAAQSEYGREELRRSLQRNSFDARP
jgi:hypothetical protein